jgi:hypothetical protein
MTTPGAGKQQDRGAVAESRHTQWPQDGRSPSAAIQRSGQIRLFRCPRNPGRYTVVRRDSEGQPSTNLTKTSAGQADGTPSVSRPRE